MKRILVKDTYDGVSYPDQEEFLGRNNSQDAGTEDLNHLDSPDDYFGGSSFNDDLN